jgi:hypothetical protein
MIKRRIVLLAILLVLSTSMPVAGADTTKTYNCVPLEVAVLDNRAHVLCAEPIQAYRGGYPLDNGYAVKYFAVPISDRNWSGRFIQVADIAMASGMPVRFNYTSGDYRGESFGCARTNCRVPWAFTLVKTSWTP